MGLTKIPQNIFNQAILRFSLLVFSTLLPHSRWVWSKGIKKPGPLHCNWWLYSRGQGDYNLWSLWGPWRILRDSWDSQRQKGSQSSHDMASKGPEQYPGPSLILSLWCQKLPGPGPLELLPFHNLQSLSASRSRPPSLGDRTYLFCFFCFWFDS